MKNPSVQRQQGAALLMMMLALIAISSALAYQFLGDLGQKLKRQNLDGSSKSMLQAKENLLIFSASLPDLYPENKLDDVRGIGYVLPPDFDNNGEMGIAGTNGISIDTWVNTRTDNVIGRMPAISKKSKGIFIYDRVCQNGVCDDDNDPLWLAVSGRSGTGNLRFQDRDSPLNSNTLLTQLKLKRSTVNQTIVLNGKEETIQRTELVKDGDSCTTQGIICIDNFPVVGVIIASGKPIQSQNRTNKTDYKQYLDLENSDTNLYNFSTRLPTGYVCASKKVEDCFNDRLLAIKAEDWIMVMEQRVKSDKDWKSMCNGTLSSKHWLMRNKWKDVSGICA